MPSIVDASVQFLDICDWKRILPYMKGTHTQTQNCALKEDQEITEVFSEFWNVVSSSQSSLHIPAEEKKY